MLSSPCELGADRSWSRVRFLKSRRSSLGTPDWHRPVEAQVITNKPTNNTACGENQRTNRKRDLTLRRWNSLGT